MKKLHKALIEKNDKASPTRNQIKAAAQRLFLRRPGFDNVTTRSDH